MISYDLKFTVPVAPGVERVLTEVFIEIKNSGDESVCEEVVLNDDLYLVWDDAIELVAPDLNDSKIIAILA